MQKSQRKSSLLSEIGKDVFIPSHRDAELPFFVARITLHSASSLDKQDLSADSELYGTTVSTPHSLRDMDGAPGAYFIYPDVGVRRRGCWRLHVSLMRVAQYVFPIKYRLDVGFLPRLSVSVQQPC